VCILLATALAGCGAIKDAYMVDSLTIDETSEPLEKRSAQFVPKPFNVAEGRLPSSKAGNSPGTVQPSAYEEAKSDTTGAMRNDLMDYLVGNSDKICDAHKAGIISTASMTNLGLTEVSTILSGLGAILTPASTVRALSGAAAITSATNANINQATYQSLVTEAVVGSIEQTRRDKLANLLLNREKALAAYSVDQMLVDVNAYHQSCSFYAGLVSLNKAVERINPTSTELEARIKALSDQYQNNMVTLAAPNTSDGVKNNLNAANATISASVAQLQSQLALTPASEK